MDTISLSIDARGVAALQLARPEKKHALSAQMMDELTAAAARLAADPAVRVVVLCAEGPAFCAGGDLGWMQQQMAADDATRAREAARLAGLLQALNDLPKPLIGRIQGDAYGGGLGLMAVCDVTVGCSTARFGFTETRLGLIPATIGPYVLARMGEAMARRVFMSARIFEAAEAVTLGILSHSVAAEALDSAIEAEVTPYLGCAPGAVAAAKRLTRRLGPVIDESVIAMTRDALVAQWRSAEAQEGISAFFSKEKPAWMR